MRRLLLLLIALGIVAFLVVSAVLARVWNADASEGAAVTAVIAAEARGQAPATVAAIPGCVARPACRARVTALSRSLARPGTVEILQRSASLGFTLGGGTGTARVAWHTTLVPQPVVQCLRVRRTGSAVSLHGLHVAVLRLSPPIRSDSECPAGL